MRVTIDIPDDLGASVKSESARRGYRGCGRLIVEALREHLDRHDARTTAIGKIAAMRGTWSTREASMVRRRIRVARSMWRSAT